MRELPGRSSVPHRRPPASRPFVTGDRAVGAMVGDPDRSLARPVDWPVWTPAALKGWAGSVMLHAILLLTLASGTSPRRSEPRRSAFDSRLAGSPHGVPEGLDLTGALNTPLPMPELRGDNLDSPGRRFADGTERRRGSSRRRHPRQAASPAAVGASPTTTPAPARATASAWHGSARGERSIRGVAVKVGDPQFTLIWDTDADLDLHVIEPGGKEIYWEEPKGKKGGELDVDNTKGFGPENIYWLVESDGPGSAKVKGPGPSGDYQWFVVYWGGFGGIAKPTHWKVRIKHGGKVVTVVHGKFRALNERSRTYHLKVDGIRGPVNSPIPIPARSPVRCANPAHPCVRTCTIVRRLLG